MKVGTLLVQLGKSSSMSAKIYISYDGNIQPASDVYFHKDGSIVIRSKKGG